MLNNLFEQARISLRVLFFLTVLLGIIYPLLITGIAQLAFPWQANGSILTHHQKKIGSVWIGQYFNQAPEYFWGRPSATQPFPYNSLASRGSNKGLFNPQYLSFIQENIQYIKTSSGHLNIIPVNFITASASGLDPEISPATAFYQIARVAKARHLSEADLIAFVKRHIQNRTFGIFGERRVNVLQLNLALDQEQGPM